MKKFFVAVLFVCISGMALAQSDYPVNSRTYYGCDNSASTFNRATFQGYAYAGMVFNTFWIGPSVDLSLGARVKEFVYVGFDTGAHFLFEMFGGYIYMPIAANVKLYIPANRQKMIYPYMNASVGGFVPLGWSGGGFYCQAGVGVDIKRFSVGIGYSGLVEDVGVHSGYLKLGVRFGGGR